MPCPHATDTHTYQGHVVALVTFCDNKLTTGGTALKVKPEQAPPSRFIIILLGESGSIQVTLITCHMAAFTMRVLLWECYQMFQGHFNAFTLNNR